MKSIEKALTVFGYKTSVIVKGQGFSALLVQKHIAGGNHSAAASFYLFFEKTLVSAVHYSAVFVGNSDIIKLQHTASFFLIITRFTFCRKTFFFFRQVFYFFGDILNAE